MGFCFVTIVYQTIPGAVIPYFHEVWGKILLLVLSVIIVTIGSAAELIVSAVIILLAEIGTSGYFGANNLLSLLDATAMINLGVLIK